jgi:two-component system sensor histidine kinase CssS
MKIGVRTWIMIPVLLLLLVFPVGTFGIFSLTSDWYVQQQASRRVERAAEVIRTEAEKNASEEMIRRIGFRMKNQPAFVRVLAFDSNYTKSYSSSSSSRSGRRGEETEWRQLLEDGKLISGQIQKVTVGGNPYLAELYVVPSGNPIPGKYFVVYERIADVSELLDETGGLLLGITAILFLISAAAVWWIARRIERPLRELCVYTARVGDGTGEQEQKKASIRELEQKEYSVRELERLRVSFLQMEERLEKTQKEKENIFQGISHDLRTPLASIIGYADGLHRGIMTDVSKASGIILEESKRMKRMAENILTLSKLDSNAIGDQKIRLSLGDFLEEQTEILQGMAVKQGKTLLLADEENEDKEKSCLVDAEPELLIRIFQNVIANCICYAEANILVHMDCRDGWISVFVEDDGPGIDEADLPHIFDRDYRGSGGRYGLGLAIAKAGTEHLGGTINAENKKPPQHGAVFCLRFPRTDTE